MRLLVYYDADHQVRDGVVRGSFAFSLFLGELARRVETMTLVTRLGDAERAYPYRVGEVGVVALPRYPSAASVVGLLKAMPVGLHRFWRALDDADVVWLLGPNVFAVAFAVLARARGRSVVLGVRQNLPVLMRHRYTRSPRWRAADALEFAFRRLARRAGVVVVGSELAHLYRHACAMQEIYVSLVDDLFLQSAPRPFTAGDGPLRMLSVGRLDPEKNPLLLADVLAAARARDPRWELDVCGDGPLREPLEARLRSLGVGDSARLHGEVPVDGGLLEMYRQSDVLIHVSHSEGVPQVILEAFAARLPVVATAVGGVPGVMQGTGLLVQPDDAGAAAAALVRLAVDGPLRAQLCERATALVREHTIQAETVRVAEFLSTFVRCEPCGRCDPAAPSPQGQRVADAVGE